MKHKLRTIIILFLLLLSLSCIISCDGSEDDDDDYDNYYESDDDDDDYDGYSDSDDDDDDDSDGTTIDIEFCVNAPDTCHGRYDTINTITFQLNPADNDTSEVYVELYDGDLETIDSRPIPYATFYFDSETASFEVPKGIYSAKAFYTVNGENIIAVDGVNINPDKINYCDATCYKGVDQVMYLDIDLDDIRKHISGDDERCFIATAAWNKNAHQVIALRQFRDSVLLKSRIGTLFVETYYKLSPPVAKQIARSPFLALTVRTLLTPLVFGITHPFVLLLIIFVVHIGLLACIIGKKYLW